MSNVARVHQITTAKSRDELAAFDAGLFVCLLSGTSSMREP